MNSPPEAMQQIGKKMEFIQASIEERLRPVMARSFYAMADCMESGGSTERVQLCVQTAQKGPEAYQKQIENVMHSFSQAMQTGMTKCQADAQQLMASGGVETGAYFNTNFAFMSHDGEYRDLFGICGIILKVRDIQMGGGHFFKRSTQNFCNSPI